MRYQYNSDVDPDNIIFNSIFFKTVSANGVIDEARVINML